MSCVLLRTACQANLQHRRVVRSALRMDDSFELILFAFWYGRFHQREQRGGAFYAGRIMFTCTVVQWGYPQKAVVCESTMTAFGNPQYLFQVMSAICRSCHAFWTALLKHAVVVRPHFGGGRGGGCYTVKFVFSTAGKHGLLSHAARSRIYSIKGGNPFYCSQRCPKQAGSWWRILLRWKCIFVISIKSEKKGIESHLGGFEPRIV